MRFCVSLNVAILQFPEIKINTSCNWKQKYSHRISRICRLQKCSQLVLARGRFSPG